jgi:kynurenine formamidase
MTIDFFELSHTIEDGLVTYPGLPAPRVSDHLPRDRAEEHYAPGTSFAITEIAMVANTGTYLDTPFHRYRDGDDLADLPLAAIANVPGICLRTDARRIGVDVFENRPLAGKAVLVATGWSRYWRSKDYMNSYPFVTREAGIYLARAGVTLVGIDSPNIDDNADPERPVHTALLGAGIPIVEHLTGVEALPDAGFRFFAVPPKIRRFTSFPVRAFALADNDLHHGR